jgi:hypothetical protein
VLAATVFGSSAIATLLLRKVVKGEGNRFASTHGPEIDDREI